MPGAGWSPVELVTTILTALGVMIAALATTLGVAAIWGYSALRDEVIKMAKAEATKAAGPIAEKEAKATAETVATKVAREFAIQTEARSAEAGVDYGHAAGSGSDDDASAPS